MDPTNQNNITAPPTPITPTPASNLQALPAISILVLALMGGLSFWSYKQSTSLNKTDKEITSLKAENKKLNEELEKRKITTGEGNVDTKAHQSVFLKSGQVYFGKITKITENQITLEKIYYLKSSTNVKDVNNLAGDVSLVKLGNELHGPQDVMYIERKEVEFWENLKLDGQVSKAIIEYEKANP